MDSQNDNDKELICRRGNEVTMKVKNYSTALAAGMNGRCVTFNEELTGGRARVTTEEVRVQRGG